MQRKTKLNLGIIAAIIIIKKYIFSWFGYKLLLFSLFKIRSTLKVLYKINSCKHREWEFMIQNIKNRDKTIKSVLESNTDVWDVRGLLLLFFLQENASNQLLTPKTKNHSRTKWIKWDFKKIEKQILTLYIPI